MQRVSGIGGIFFKASDPAALRAWYQTHLGIDVQAWGGAAFSWAGQDGAPVAGSTIWSISGRDDEHFAPGTAPFMINYRVPDLAGLLAALRAEGCTVLGESGPTDYGLFGWVLDPENNKIELWQPQAGQ